MTKQADLDAAMQAAKERGPIAPKSVIAVEAVQRLIESGITHPDPMINYLVIEVRKMIQQTRQQREMLAQATAQVENLKATMIATQGVIQKTTYDIAQLHAFARDVKPAETPAPPKAQA